MCGCGDSRHFCHLLSRSLQSRLCEVRWAWQGWRVRAPISLLPGMVPAGMQGETRREELGSHSLPLSPFCAGHGAPVTALAAVSDPASPPTPQTLPAAAASLLLSVSLDGRAKLWDVWSSALVGTARLAGPATALQVAAANPLLQPHSVILACGPAVQLLDLRSMAPAAAVLPPASAGPAVRCLAQWGQDLALGGDDGCRLYDLRMLGSGGGGNRGAGGGRGAATPHRLLLRGHAGGVSSVHVDRLKVVTATDAYGEHPLRAWCPETGQLLAAFDSALPQQPSPAAAAVEESLLQALAAAAAGDDAALATAEAAQAALVAPTADEVEGAVAAAAGQQQQQGSRYRREWEGVTAMTCIGACLVSGNSEGIVSEMDFSSGDGLLDGGGRSEHEGSSKFWQQ